MRIKLILTAVILFPALALAQVNTLDSQIEKVYVYLKGEAETTTGQILLGDVAEVSGFNEKLIGSLNRLPLGPAPMPGESLTLAKADIRRSLVTHRIDPVKVALVGENLVEVKRSGRTITKEDIAPLVDNYVERSWADRQVRTEIIYSRPVEDITIQENDFDLQVLDPVRPRVCGSIALSLAALENDRMLVRIPVSLKVRAFGKVAVMNKEVRQGELLSPEDFSLIEREITRKSSNPVRTAEEAAYKKLKRNVKAGQILTLDHLEIPPLIERGDEITLIVQYKGIRVSCPGKAWEKGRLGDRIMVRNQYGKNLVGEVKDTHTVLITH
jgi:flagella basal body P-ring formation protein FlgA